MSSLGPLSVEAAASPSFASASSIIAASTLTPSILWIYVKASANLGDTYSASNFPPSTYVTMVDDSVTTRNNFI